MGKTNITGLQIADATVQRQDIDTVTTGKALITKIVQGSGISISSTGVDSGTGDVTVTAPHLAGDYTPAQIGAEPALGNPSTSGWILSSTSGGVRSWIAPPAAPVTSVFGRTGPVVAQASDYTPAFIGAEPALGNPSANGYVLSSTVAGVRSWVAQSGGGGGAPGGSTKDFQWNNAGAFAGGSGLTNEGAGVIQLSLSQNALTQYLAQNVNAGASAQATFISKNGTYQANYGITGTGLSAAGDITANAAYLYTDAPTLLLITNNASGVIKFAPGNTLASSAWLYPSGGLSVGANIDAGAGYVNANTGLKIGGANIFPVPVASGGTGTTLGAEPPLGSPPVSGYILSSTTAGARSWVAMAGGGNVSNVGTPASGQMAQWTGTTTIQGIGTTGSGNAVLATSPTITTPTIAALANLTSNGFVKTSGGIGTLSVDTSTYLTANQTVTLSGDITGSGTTSIATTYNNAVPTAKGGVPSAGTAGYGLYKNTATNYDYSWKQPASYQGAELALTAGTISTTGVHAGMAGSITPTVTGRVLVIVAGYMYSSVAGQSAGILTNMRYGTGSAPAHGAAPTGTAAPSSAAPVGTSNAANAFVPFSLQVVITGLTVGTTYWLDVIYVSGIATSTAKLGNHAMTIVEF